MNYFIYIFCINIFIYIAFVPYCYPMNDCDRASQKVREEIWKGHRILGSINDAITKCTNFAKNGDVRSQYNLSMLYYVKNNNQEDSDSYTWVLAAAKNGHADSQYRLGTMYENGVVVKQDYPEAIKWYREASKNGFSQAEFKLDKFEEIQNKSILNK